MFLFSLLLFFPLHSPSTYPFLFDFIELSSFSLIPIDFLTILTSLLFNFSFYCLLIVITFSFIFVKLISVSIFTYLPIYKKYLTKSYFILCSLLFDYIFFNFILLYNPFNISFFFNSCFLISNSIDFFKYYVLFYYVKYFICFIYFIFFSLYFLRSFRKSSNYRLLFYF
jgi:hypothetical protein